MTRIAMTLNELQGLLQVITELSDSQPAKARFEQFLASASRLVPFDYCIFLHERVTVSGRLSVRYEFADFENGRAHIALAEMEPYAVTHLLASLSMTNTLRDAFCWTGRTGSLPGSAQDPASLTARLSRIHGIGASAQGSFVRSAKCTSAILFPSSTGDFWDRHLAFVNYIIRPLHRAMLDEADMVALRDSVCAARG